MYRPLAPLRWGTPVTKVFQSLLGLFRAALESIDPVSLVTSSTGFICESSFFSSWLGLGSSLALDWARVASLSLAKCSIFCWPRAKPELRNLVWCIVSSSPLEARLGCWLNDTCFLDARTESPQSSWGGYEPELRTPPHCPFLACHRALSNASGACSVCSGRWFLSLCRLEWYIPCLPC